MANNPTPMSSKERLELALWSIERLDNLRASASNRAAMVISADAILLAGTTFLIDKGISAYKFVDTQAIIYIICALLALILVLLSVIYASNTIVFVWRSTKNAVGVKDLPKSLFFHPSDTVATFKDFGKFEKTFKSSTTDDMLKSALGELMQITLAHHKRYKSLRTSIRLLLVAVIPFMVCLLLLIIDFFR